MIDLSIKSNFQTLLKEETKRLKNSRSAGDITRASPKQKVLDRYKTFYSPTGGTEAEAEYDVLKDEGLLK